VLYREAWMTEDADVVKTHCKLLENTGRNKWINRKSKEGRRKRDKNRLSREA
jgi:hypothetical protein